MKPSSVYKCPFLVPFLIQLVIACEWITAGWEKIHGGVFSSGIAKTLETFASKNPHAWYVDSVLNIAKQHSALFGQLVQWGEFLAGLGLIASIVIFTFGTSNAWKRTATVIAVAALIGAAFLSANFYVAAGWTGASTSGLNAVLFWVELILVLSWVRGKKDIS